VTQVVPNTLQEPSTSKVGGSWHISDRWTAADIDATARIANSSLQSTHILARAARRLSILSGIVLYSIVVAVLAFLLSSAATTFMPADWFETVDPYVRVTAFVLAFVALNVVFILGFGYRKKRHEVYALHQVVNDDGIRSSIPGFNCEFHWENTSRIVEDGAYILLFHEGGRYYLAVPSRGFSKQDRHEFLTYCRDHIASARPQS
jgi:hypothetical protein